MQSKLAAGTSIGAVGVAGVGFQALKLANALPSGALATGGLLIGGAVAGGLVTYFLMKKFGQKSVSYLAALTIFDSIESRIKGLKLQQNLKDRLSAFVNNTRSEYKSLLEKNQTNTSIASSLLAQFGSDMSTAIVAYMQDQSSFTSSLTNKLKEAISRKKDDNKFEMLVLMEFVNLLSPINIPTEYLPDEGHQHAFRKVRADIKKWFEKLNKSLENRDGVELREFLEKEVQMLENLKKTQRSWWTTLFGGKEKVIAADYKRQLADLYTDDSYFINIFNFMRLRPENPDRLQKEVTFLQVSLQKVINNLDEIERGRFSQWNSVGSKIVVAASSSKSASYISQLLKEGEHRHEFLKTALAKVPTYVREGIVSEFLLYFEVGGEKELRDMVFLLRKSTIMLHANATKSKQAEKSLTKHLTLANYTAKDAELFIDSVRALSLDIAYDGSVVETEVEQLSLKKSFEWILSTYVVRSIMWMIGTLVYINMAAVWSIVKAFAPALFISLLLIYAGFYYVYTGLGEAVFYTTPVSWFINKFTSAGFIESYERASILYATDPEELEKLNYTGKPSLRDASLFEKMKVPMQKLLGYELNYGTWIDILNDEWREVEEIDGGSLSDGNGNKRQKVSSEDLRKTAGPHHPWTERKERESTFLAYLATYVPFMQRLLPSSAIAILSRWIFRHARVA